MIQLRKSSLLGGIRVTQPFASLDFCQVSSIRHKTEAVSVCQLQLCSSSSQPRQQRAEEVVQGAAPPYFDAPFWLPHPQLVPGERQACSDQYLHRPKTWNRGLSEEGEQERLQNFDLSQTRSKAWTWVKWIFDATAEWKQYWLAILSRETSKR